MNGQLSANAAASTSKTFSRLARLLSSRVNPPAQNRASWIFTCGFSWSSSRVSRHLYLKLNAWNMIFVSLLIVLMRQAGELILESEFGVRGWSTGFEYRSGIPYSNIGLYPRTPFSYSVFLFYNLLWRKISSPSGHPGERHRIDFSRNRHRFISNVDQTGWSLWIRQVLKCSKLLRQNHFLSES